MFKTSAIVFLACLIAALGTSVDPAAAAAADAGMATGESAHPDTGPNVLVNGAAAVVEKMKADPELEGLLQRARGVYIVPNYAKGAFLVGGSGGEGVLLAHNGKKWSDPLFYDIGSISIGAQAGGESGNIAMLLMTDSALRSFEGDNNFSLSADAGYTIVDYSTKREASLGKGVDVILWSDTQGAFGGATLGATDIVRDRGDDQAFYGEPVHTMDVLSGKTSSPKAETLQQALPR